MNLLPLLLKYWKYAAGAAVLALIAWQIHSYGARQYDAGKVHVQMQWDAAKVQQQQVADAEKLKREVQDAADAARNKGIEDDYKAKLAAADAGRSRLERQLRNAITATAAGAAASEGAGIPGTAPAGTPGSAQPPDAATGLAADLAAALTEAKQNAEQLDALIAEIKPQIAP